MRHEAMEHGVAAGKAPGGKDSAKNNAERSKDRPALISFISFFRSPENRELYDQAAEYD